MPVGPDEAREAQEAWAAFGPPWEGPRREAHHRRLAGLAASMAGPNGSILRPGAQLRRLAR